MKMAVLMNHQLSSTQKAEAQGALGVQSFVAMPPEVAALWCNADPAKDLHELGAENVICWLTEQTEEGDYVIVQGDYGLTFAVVDWCLKTGRVPVHATTERKAVEKNIQGNIVVERVFNHVKFRVYKSISDKGNRNGQRIYKFCRFGKPK